MLSTDCMNIESCVAVRETNWRCEIVLKELAEKAVRAGCVRVAKQVMRAGDDVGLDPR